MTRLQQNAIAERGFGTRRGFLAGFLVEEDGWCGNRIYCEKGPFVERRCVGKTGHDKVIAEKWSGPGNEVPIAERDSIRGKSPSEVRSGSIGCDGVRRFAICLFAFRKKYLYI